MIKIKLSKNETELKGRRNINFVGGTYEKLNTILKQELKIGTCIKVSSDNERVKKHRGKYYLLYVEEIGVYYLFYQDVWGKLITVQTGNIENAVVSLYYNVADDAIITILNGKGKKAYRCAAIRYDIGDRKLVPIAASYLDKSSKVKSQMYLKLYDAIMFAANQHNMTDKQFSVITRKGTELITFG